MIINNITQKFLDNPGYLKNGAGYLAEQWKCSKDEIYEAKSQARQIMAMTEAIERANDTANSFEVQVKSEPLKYTGSETTPDGTVKKYESDKPLTPKEIEELAGVDGINTYVARVWDKLLPNGKWTYSIDIRYRVKDFYDRKELNSKLLEIMSSVERTPFNPMSVPKGFNNRCLNILLADDHVGAINVTNLFDNPHVTYRDRLLMILDEVADLGQEFDEVHIISLGDQLNGWNSQTTRGGHEVKSKSNKEQFDEYVAARMEFYTNIFESGISQNYYVHDVENSNHSGLGMSYMANQALKLWIDAKYPWVIQESITDMVGGFQYGQHVVMFGHGKDEKFQIRPMPAVLNDKTDLFLYDLAQNKGYSPYNDSITFYKGDLHQHGLQNGKFGRYVNVQSLAGNSDYGDLNFGNTKGGALLEILQKDSYKITSQAIWF